MATRTAITAATQLARHSLRHGGRRWLATPAGAQTTATGTVAAVESTGAAQGGWFRRKVWLPTKQGFIDMVTDYKDVFVDMGKSIVKHPFRTMIQLSIVGGLVWATEVCPTEQDYNQALRTAQVELSELSELVRNRKSHDFVLPLVQLYNEGRLRFVDCGFFMLVLQRKSPTTVGLFREQYISFPEQVARLPEMVVDIGFNKHFFFLKRFMHDYDINEFEEY
eukprot:m.362492 g.362492  ORF g.362492 m.362492 type:complete len:222 (-) comp20548_c0_seq1:407-1072(-)